MKEESNQKALYWGLLKHSEAFFYSSPEKRAPQVPGWHCQVKIPMIKHKPQWIDEQKNRGDEGVSVWQWEKKKPRRDLNSLQSIKTRAQKTNEAMAC